MTATLTALIELGVDHGFGVAFLLVGGQLLLDRLMPLERLVSHLASPPKRPAHTGGAHRQVSARHRNGPLRCCTE